MGDRLHNRLVQRRQTLGLTQQALARRAGIARQSLASLEGGRSVPSTALALRLAQILGCGLDSLFWLEGSASLSAELASTGRSAAQAPSSPGPRRPSEAARRDRVALVSVEGKWVAHRLSREDPLSTLVAADGFVGRSVSRRSPGPTARVNVSLLRDREELRETLLCVGCAPALGVLAARAALETPAQRILWLERSSSSALEMLQRGQVHLAGAHLFDEDTGEFNVPIVARLFPGRSMRVIQLARWEAGIVLPPGNPRRIRRLEDLARPGLGVLPRDPGSGAEKLLLRLLRRAQIPESALRRRGQLAKGHMDVARAIAMGAADAGVAIRSAALAHGLEFLPLAEERFDLVVAGDLSSDPRVVRLLDLLCSRPFRRELESLGGYAVRESGSLIASLGAP
jgi:molybdate-binding protein/DNA-binding XRE family transcriptional regulator